MIDCLIIGDSIANGVSSIERACSSYTKVGISPKNFYEKYSNQISKENSTTVISLGSNNPGNKNELYKNILNVRDKLKTQKIIWILPNNPKLKIQIKELAEHFGDKYVEFEVSKDGIHPKSYKNLSKKINEIVEL